MTAPKPQDAQPDLASLWQTTMSNWQQGFESLAGSFAQGAQELWSQSGIDVAGWQDRWRAALEEYEEKARPYQEQMLDTLRELVASWPVAARPMADAVIDGLVRGLEAERQWLDTLKAPAPGIETRT